ncbi:hypothetical protein ACWIGM_08795 [Bosea sp. NPDC055332]
MTFPDDIVRAAREAFITAAPQMDRASADRIRAGAMDDSHATTIIATAILAERQRCVELARAEAALLFGMTPDIVGELIVEAIQGPQA